MNPLTTIYANLFKFLIKVEFLKNHTDVLKKGVNIHGYVHNF